jgi:esterase/lipase
VPVSTLIGYVTTGTSSGLSISDETAVIGLIITVAGIVGGYLLRFFVQRGDHKGKVSTSAAETLWQQAQAMREMLLAEKQKTEEQLDKVAEQRDRLLDSHATQILPMIAAINDSLEKIAAGIGAVLAKTDEILDGREPSNVPTRKEAPQGGPDSQRRPRGPGQ